MEAGNSLSSPDFVINIYKQLGAYITILHCINSDNIIVHIRYRGKELEQEVKGLEYRINPITFLNVVDEMYQKHKIADTIARKMLGEDVYEYRVHYKAQLMYNPNKHNKVIINLTEYPDEDDK